MGEKVYSREDMIEDVQDVAGELGEQYITIQEYKEHGNFPFETLMSRFVNWQKVMEEAGLEQSKVTKKQVMKDFKEIADGEDITVREYTENGGYDYHYIQKYFGGIGNLKDQLGIEEDSISKEEVIEDLRKVDEKTDRPLTMSKYKEIGNFDAQTIQYKFGWNDIKEEAGLEVSKRGSISKVSEKMDEVVEMFEEGLTRKKIASKLDMSYTHFISEISKIGINIRNKITRTGGGSFIVTINENNIEKLGFDPDKNLYYDKEVKNGSIVFTLSENRVDRDSLPENQ